MTKLGRLWTAGIAYVALAVGAGLSIMYNVVDVVAVRGSDLDGYDVITAIAAPGVVVLMVELFVSRQWVGRRWYFQLLRWMATLVIGGVAMRASWTHGHDFMARRGQASDVATLWPLAIDLLAIMATALILAGRRSVASGQSRWVNPGQVATKLASGQAVASADMANLVAMQDRINVARDSVAKATGIPGHTLGQSDEATLANREEFVAKWTDHLAGQTVGQEVSDDLAKTYATIADEASQYLASQDTQLPQRRPSPAKYDRAAAVDAIRAALAVGTEPAAVDAAVSGAFGISARTARRLRAQVSGEPVSGPPDEGAEDDPS